MDEILLAIIGLAVLIFILLLYFSHRYIKKLSISINLFRFLWDYLILEPITFVFRWLPGGWGIFLRYPFYKIILKRMGWNVTILEGVKIGFPERFEIGRNCSINPNCFFDAQGGIRIGNWVRIGAGCSFTTVINNSENPSVPMKKQGITQKGVKIEDDVVISINSVILPGVKIGKGSYIGAGAVVGIDIPPYSIAVGNPARVVKSRKKEQHKD